MQKKACWHTYEQVAVHLLNELAEEFGLGHVEGKQVVPGKSGTSWELDGKGCSVNGARIVIIECKQHLSERIPQSTVAGIAWQIQDVGALGAIIVSPLGLQSGAEKVAAASGVVSVTMRPKSTTSDYLLKFLNQIHLGISDQIAITDKATYVLTGPDGKIKQTSDPDVAR